MKKTFLRVCIPLLCAVMLFSACNKAPSMDYHNGVYTVKGVSYVPAPAYYEAVAIVEDKVVAKIEYKEMDDLMFYEIKDVDPAQMISSANYELFHAVNMTLPELWEMDVNKAHICQTAAMSYSLATMEKAEDLTALVDAYQNGISFAANEIDAGLKKEKYELKFASNAYPAFFYCLTYWEFENDVLLYEDIEDPDTFVSSYPGVPVEIRTYSDGTYYAEYNFGIYILYNRTTGTCWAIGDTVANYLEDSAE